MKHFRLLSLLLPLFAMPQAFAQAPSPKVIVQSLPSVAFSQPSVKEIPTPDSMVWRAFYDNHRPATETQDFLVTKLGLTSSEAATVVTAGQQYVKQLSAIDDATNAEIGARFKPAYLPSNLGQILQSAGLPPPPPNVPMGGRMADGRTVEDAILADGLPTRAQRQRDAALQAHQVQLRQTIGPQKFMALQAWVNSNVAPRIKSFDMTPPVPAPLTNAPVFTVSPPTN